MGAQSSIQISQDRQDESIVLESEEIRVLIDPRAGGKIRSFFSKSTQTEFFYTDPRGTSIEEGTDYTRNHDISGYDECFPTVWPCAYPDGKRKGNPMGDHGYLWQGPWHARIEDDCVKMSKDIPEFECCFERTCRLDSERSLRLDYTITHDGDEPLKYIYSAHPLLAAREDTQLVLPEEINKMFVFAAENIPGLSNRSWIDWPPPRSVDIGLQPPFSTKNESEVKLYCPRLRTGRAAVHRADVGEALQFEFDTAALPYLGVLISQGYDSDEGGDFEGELILALEPTTGIGDDLPTCESTGTVQNILPGQSVAFWIRLTLLDL